MQQYLTLWDLVLTPLYLIAIVALARRFRNKNYAPKNPLRKYYLPGLYVKLGGAIFIALIYQFYYQGGDTFFYYQYSKVVNSSLSDSITMWTKLLMRTPPETDPFLYEYSNQIQFYQDPSSYMVIRITALLGLLTFNTYLPTALLFASVAYTGIWALYTTFCKAFPNRYKEMAIAFLFVPSVAVWGSAIFKDTVCMFGLGWMVYTSFRIFIDRDFSVKNIVLLVLSFYLIAVIKVYILLAFLPSLLLWLLLTYSHKIRSRAVRFFLSVGILGIVVLSFTFVTDSFSAELKNYSLQEITQTIEATKGWITYSGDESATYDLGKFDPSLLGIVRMFPAGITVTLFRPFLWEVKKPIQFLSALESLAFLVATVVIFVKNGPRFTFKQIFSNPNLIFFFTFSLIFAFAVGISTGNFGTLSRYKIPCMPFFTALLMMLYYSKQTSVKKPAVSLRSPGEVSTNTSSYSR